MSLEGLNVDVAYTLLLDDTVVSEGAVQHGETTYVYDLTEGSYELRMTLPSGALLTQINGIDFALEGEFSLSVPVISGMEQPVEMVLTRYQTIGGTTEEIPDGTLISLVGEGVTMSLQVENQAYMSDKLLPGAYTLTMMLPVGTYAGDGWQVQEQDGQVVATAICQLGAEEPLTVPTLSLRHVQTVKGTLIGQNGQPAAGAEVLLLNEQGASVAESVTDAQGIWELTGMEPGRYILRAMQDGSQLGSDAVVEVSLDETIETALYAQKGEASLTVQVFLDANNNGECGAYEDKMEGVAVQLLRMSGESGLVIAEGISDHRGEVMFADLAAGEYTIHVTLPSGYGFSKQSDKAMSRNVSIMPMEDENEQTSDVITVEGGRAISAGVGATPMSSIKGQVWLDVNGDGIRTEDEPGQAGILLEAIGVRNGRTYQVVTGEDGYYVLDQLRPGSYTLQATVPEGYTFTKYSAEGRDNRSIITDDFTHTGSKSLDLNKAKSVDEQNVGVQHEAVVEVKCFLDANHNGLYDEGEQPLEGMKCELRKQSNDELVASVSSDANGVVRFDTLRANTYKVRAILPNSNTYFTATAEGGNQFVARSGQKEAMLTGVVVTTSEHKEMVVGLVMHASLEGRVYMDADFSGAYEAGEKTVSGMVMTLQDAEGNVVKQARTDNQGIYSFKDLEPGMYQITTTATDGYAFTRTGKGSVMVNQGDGKGATELFFLEMDTVQTDMDCGMIVPSMVQGSIYEDANDNGRRDGGEGGAMDVTVRLLDENGETLFTATPDANGTFEFDAVMPGTYRVCYALPGNGVYASNTELDEQGRTEAFAVGSGDSVILSEVGALKLSRISGTAFEDLNANGIMDEGEQLMAGVQLVLRSQSGDAESTAVTDETGAFLIRDIRPGDYTLEIRFPDGYVMSRSDGSLPVTLGDVVSREALTVEIGNMWEQVSLGATKPVSLQGQVWLDVNMNGVLDAEDILPAGEEIAVLDAVDGAMLAQLTSDSKGVFATEGLVPGEYVLVYQPDENTQPTSGSINTFAASEDGSLVMAGLQARSGETLSDISLGLVRTTTLGGWVWKDDGGNIAGLADASVELLDEQGSVMRTVTSDENGQYEMTGVLPGTYTLQVTLPEGNVVVEPEDERITSGRLQSIMTHCSQRTATSDTFTLTMGDHRADLDIGAVQPGTVGDLCWLDLNGNGLQESDEGGIPGLTITLLRNGEVVTETITDQYGFYCFPDVYPAVYTMRVTMPAEIVPTALRDDYPGIVSMLQESGETMPFQVTSARKDYDKDMGFALVQQGIYPAGYGEGAVIDWTVKNTGN